MVAAWACQDCVGPLDLSDKRAANIKLLKELVEEGEKKPEVKEGNKWAK